MNFSTFDAVFFTAGFLVPGFIWSAVLSVLVPRRKFALENRTLEFLTLSCLNHGLWSWALFLIFRTGYIDQQPYWSGAFLFGIILLSPAGLGLFTAWLQQRNLIGGFLQRYGYRTIHRAPTAWDYYFSQQMPCWCLVSLKDGSQVYGLCAGNSFAGDHPEFRDLYLEEAFELLDDGQWAPMDDTGGVLIMPDHIATIEFRKIISEVSDE